MQDPTLEEMRDFLNHIIRHCDTISDDSEFDREEAIYWYSSDCHNGQGSNLYSALSQSHFNPSPLAHNPSSFFAMELYDALVEEYS